MKDEQSKSTDSNQEIAALKRKIFELEQSIAESRLSEKSLRESEARFRFLSQNMADIAFMVDMNLCTTYVNPSVERVLGFTPEERMAQNMNAQLSPASVQLVFETLSAEMSRENKEDTDPDRSQTLLLEYYHKDGSVRNLETNIRGIRDKNGNLTGFYGLSRDVTKRKETEKDLRKTLESLRNAIGTTIQVMVATIEARDPSTAGHQIRTADLARAIATEIGLTQEQIEGIRIVGSIHDIGKLAVPAEILSKPAKLSELEFLLIQEHPLKGYEILKNIGSSWPLAEIIYQHHERMDGSGYPNGIKGEHTLLEARILAVADVVEAMSSHRPYRSALGIPTALEEIEKNKGILYDSDVVDACLRLFREKDYKLKEV